MIAPDKLSGYLKLTMVAVVLAGVLLSGRAIWNGLHGSSATIGTYKQCVEAGNTISGWMPRVCTTKEGKKYAENTEDMYQVVPPTHVTN